jgi:tetratricopeptide (TPR) repeat protein
MPPRFGHSVKPGYCIFATVLFFRLFALSRLSSSAFLLPGRGDMHFYNDWAQRILRGELTDHLAFYGLPLYAYLLAFLYRIVGYNPFVPGFFQACLDAGTAVLAYAIALKIFDPNEHASAGGAERLLPARRVELVGVTAAFAWFFFVPAQAYAVILMPTTWFIFVFWFVVWRIVRNENAPSWQECLLLGLLLGVTAMAVATILFLLPLVLAALLTKPKIDNRPRHRLLVTGATILLVGVGLGTSPCWIHNYFVARDPVFLSAHSGINLWIGNNPAANGYPRFPPGLHAGQAAMLQDSITVAETKAGRQLKRSDVSAYWSGKAKVYIESSFGAWLKLIGLKLCNFWNAFQYDDLSIITNLREQRIILPGLYFGIVAALAIPGMLLGWRLALQSRWVTAAILLHMAALLPVFITERYRLAVVPGLLLFAVFGLSILWESCVAGDYRRLALYCTLLVGSTIFVSWPQRNPSLWALDAYNSGWQALESNNLPLAEKKLALAYAYVPDNSETNFAFGNLRLAQGNVENAKLFYRTTLQIDPKHKGAFNNLGVIALDANQLNAAETWFRCAIDVDPRNSKTHFLLARTLFGEGKRAAALAEIEQAINLKADQPEFLALRKEVSRPPDRHE